MGTWRLGVDFDEAARRRAVEAHQTLRDHRRALIEKEARRLTAMAESNAGSDAQTLGEDRRFGAKEGLGRQRDPLARSLWAYLNAKALFEAGERGMQVRVYREHGKLYEAWSIEASIPLTADAVDGEALEQEIAMRLQHEDGCKVEAVDLPSDEGDSREVLLAVTFFGAYSSQRTVRPDKTTNLIYFRPPDELLLVYAPGRQTHRDLFARPRRAAARCPHLRREHAEARRRK